MPKPPVNPTEFLFKKFGRLVVLAQAERKYKHHHWHCRCDCGKEVTISGISLRKGLALSCGCLIKETTSKLKTSHGLSKSKIYSIWRSMLNRCYRASKRDFRYYQGRGITVCPEWHLFENFLADMGIPPTAKHSIDRKNNNLGYFKDNCRWSTSAEQSKNRRNVK